VELDPTTGGIIGVFITTVGLIVVAIINNRKERNQAAVTGIEVALDERNVLERMLALIADNERKEKIIQAKDTEIEALKTERDSLRAELALQRGVGNDRPKHPRHGKRVDKEV
jgi:hypothetical protein